METFVHRLIQLQFQTIQFTRIEPDLKIVVKSIFVVANLKVICDTVGFVLRQANCYFVKF